MSTAKPQCVRLPLRPELDWQPEGESLIRFDHVRTRRGGKLVLNDLSFRIVRGEIVCLLGPNGAGKSTTLQHLLGTLAAESGTIEILDGSPRDQAVRVRIGCTPQETGFPEHITVAETLRLIAAHYSNPRAIEDALRDFGLESLAKRKTSALSGGQRRCLALACAMIGNPDLVLLDEPTTGLDVDMRRRLWENVRNYVRCGGTVVFTTHYLEEAEALASRVLVIDRGRILASGDVSAIKASVGLKQIAFICEQELELDARFAEGTRIEREADRYRVWTAESDEFVRALAMKHDYRDLEVQNARLEDAFVLMFEKSEVGS